ncbi:hypothetical protein C8R46DRAFT_1207038 [Mycena filopes]|nr:hypothetical protein C8R46DRAFT_1207038 [Mycena filopes]
MATTNVTVFFHPLDSRIPKGFRDGPFHTEDLPDGPLEKYDIICSRTVADLWESFHDPNGSISRILATPVPGLGPSPRDSYADTALDRLHRQAGNNAVPIARDGFVAVVTPVDDACIELKMASFMFATLVHEMAVFRDRWAEVENACSVWDRALATKDHLSRCIQHSLGGGNPQPLAPVDTQKFPMILANLPQSTYIRVSPSLRYRKGQQFASDCFGRRLSIVLQIPTNLRCDSQASAV